MGLPKIRINFFASAFPRPQRDPAGIVALILKDDTQTDLITYKQGDEVVGWSENNIDYIELALEGGPRQVIAVPVATTAENYGTALDKLKNKRFNYLAIPEISEVETNVVAEWIKTKRNDDRKTFKAVLPNTNADHEAIINFTTTNIVANGKEYTTAEFTARIAGVLAGLPFTRSATYYELDEVESIAEIDNPDDAINNGELILINDGEKIKIGRGVNSLTTIGPEVKKNEEFKSIRAIDIMDMIHDEIYDNFNNHYVGKVPNTYDNQVLFINEVNRGFRELEGLGLLSPTFDNKAWVDVQAQRKAWENAGVDTTDWDDQQVKENPFRRNLFLAGRIRIVDTTEDLDFNIEI